MIQIIVNNNKCKLVGDLKLLIKIRNNFSIKHPNAFWVRKSSNVSNWDGKVYFITESFYFKTGLLTHVYDYIKKELNQKVKIEDNRLPFGVEPVVPKKYNGYDFTGVRSYQVEAVEKIVHNKVGNISLPVGIIDAATNAGKTIMMALLYLSYHKKIPAIVLLKDGDLFEQFKKEIPDIIGNEDFGYVRGKEAKWNKFTIVMVQTISRDINKYKKELSKFGIVAIDEADESGSDSYTKIISNLINTSVRVGLSGSIFMSKLKKDQLSNARIKEFLGDVVFKITKQEMVKKGLSSDVVIKIFEGNTNIGTNGDYMQQYDNLITNNEKRLKNSIDRLKFNVKVGRTPALLIGRFREHVESTYKAAKKEFPNKRVEYVHAGINSNVRKTILEDFRVGKVDILVSSFIIKRGKNHPLIKYIQNISATDSNETISQIMGRGERIHDNKKKYHLDDFYDKGHYLERHSKHRIMYYKKEGFKLIMKF